MAEAVVQACRTDIPVHIIIKVCPLARLITYLSPVRFLSLNVNNIVLPLDFESLEESQKEFKYEKYVLFHLPLKEQPYSKID